GADVRHHQMTPNSAAGQIRPHVGELCHRDQLKDVKMPREFAAARPWSQINDFRDEIKKPKHVKQTEQRVGHRLQRLIVAKPSKELSSKDRQQEKKEDGDFEIVGMRRPDFGKVIKTAGEHDS